MALRRRIHPYRIAALLLGLAGLGLLVWSVFFYNYWVLRALLGDLPQFPRVWTYVGWVRKGIFGLGGTLFVLGCMVYRIKPLHALMARRAALPLLCVGLFGLLPLALLEAMLQPFCPHIPKTAIYMPDGELGWKHRPSVHDQWAGMDLAINDKGLRNPPVDYAKPAGTQRVLFLGDSIVFGFRVQRTEDTFAYQAGPILNQLTGQPVQTINAGVGGYSPWQEYLYLKDEGLKFDPDVVVLTFILNDVEDPFKLQRFGGRTRGFQLDTARLGFFKDLIDHSAIWYYARRLGAGVGLSGDARQRAVDLENLNVRTLLEQPQSEVVQQAWHNSFEWLDKIQQLCSERGIPFVLLSYPYTFQYEMTTDGRDAPQRELAAWARSRAVPFVDFMPLLERDAQATGSPIQDYFVDDNHLSVKGMGFSARVISEELVRLRLVAKDKDE